MKRKMSENYLFKCIFIVLIFFIVDSVISFFLPYNYEKVGISIIPCMGLMLFSLLVKSIQGAERYFFGALCGIYYSVVYSNSLAIYILIYTLIAFIRSYLIKLESFSFVEALLFCESIIFFQEIVIYWLMWITNMTRYPIYSFFIMRIIPTLLFNLILFGFVYWIYTKIKIEVE